MGMDQYLLLPFLRGWTSIYQLFWCSPGVQGFDTLPHWNDGLDHDGPFANSPVIPSHPCPGLYWGRSWNFEEPGRIYHAIAVTLKVCPKQISGKLLSKLPTDPIRSSLQIESFGIVRKDTWKCRYVLQTIGFYAEIDHFRELEAPNTQIQHWALKGHCSRLNVCRDFSLQLGTFSDLSAASKRRQQAASSPPNKQHQPTIWDHMSLLMIARGTGASLYSLQESSSTSQI
jgi:hypothetical protein